MKKLYRVINMRIRYFEEKIEQVIEEGIEIGKEEQLIEIYKTLAEQFTLDEIAKLLKKTSEIKTIIKLN